MGAAWRGNGFVCGPGSGCAVEESWSWVTGNGGERIDTKHCHHWSFHLGPWKLVYQKAPLSRDHPCDCHRLMTWSKAWSWICPQGTGADLQTWMSGWMTPCLPGCLRRGRPTLRKRGGQVCQSESRSGPAEPKDSSWHPAGKEKGEQEGEYTLFKFNSSLTPCGTLTLSQI